MNEKMTQTEHNILYFEYFEYRNYLILGITYAQQFPQFYIRVNVSVCVCVHIKILIFTSGYLKYLKNFTQFHLFTKMSHITLTALYNFHFPTKSSLKTYPLMYF